MRVWKLLACVLAFPVLAQAADGYRLKVLSGNYNGGLAINAGGTVVGAYFDPSIASIYGFLWQPATNSAWRPLPEEGVQRFIDINDRGTVLGQRGDWGEQYQAYLYQNGVRTYLANPAEKDVMGLAVNNNGVVAGYLEPTYGTQGVRSAFVASGGVVTNLGTFGGKSAVAADLNDAGTVVGNYVNAAGFQRAFVYDATGFHELATPREEAAAITISESGVIAGVYGDKADSPRAFMYQNGVMTDLGEINGRAFAPEDINIRNQIVGHNGSNGAFLFENGKMIDVDTLLNHNDASSWDLQTAIGINDAGQITGKACSIASPQTCGAYVLTPVPEPSTYGMLLAGLGVVGWAGRRRTHLNKA